MIMSAMLTSLSISIEKEASNFSRRQYQLREFDGSDTKCDGNDFVAAIKHIVDS